MFDEKRDRKLAKATLATEAESADRADVARLQSSPLSFLICNHSPGLSERAAFRNSAFNATKTTAGSSSAKRPKAEFKSSSLTKRHNIRSSAADNHT